jgi:hypothetical protein
MYDKEDKRLVQNHILRRCKPKTNLHLIRSGRSGGLPKTGFLPFFFFSIFVWWTSDYDDIKLRTETTQTSHRGITRTSPADDADKG